MSDAGVRNFRSIHIDIPEYAPADEVEAFEDALAEFALGWEPRGQWDPFIHSHPDACEDSDHCYGPGSYARRDIVKNAWEYATSALRPDFPEAVARLGRVIAKKETP